MKLENLNNSIDPSWHTFLTTLDRDYLLSLINLIEENKEVLAPKPNLVFKALRMPLEGIKVVLIGQDPYHTKDVATGLSFATNDIRTPSLRQIEAELASNKSNPFYKLDYTLEEWNKQGVFLLNCALTTIEGTAGQHTKQWKTFTDKLISFISDNTTNIVWLLWGNFAKQKQELISSNHCILTHTHPQAANFNKVKFPFVGCNHFTLTNKYLTQHGIKEIQW